MAPQAKYWLLTIPALNDTVNPYTELAPELCYLKGQQEIGGETGYRHWQLLAVFKNKVRMGAVKKIFGNSSHCEPSKSEAANDYVWKEETRVPGTKFEIGTLPFKRNNRRDWEIIRDLARRGDLDNIDAQTYVCHYNSLKRIMIDNMKAEECEREVRVYWGETGLGKSRKAWEEATFDAYPKDPNTKFWDGYRGQENVVMDEFRGLISISHLLRWLDRYPVCVETKGSGCVLRAKRIWITSNLDPRDWYQNLDQPTLNALLRRLKITHFILPQYSTTPQNGLSE